MTFERAAVDRLTVVRARGAEGVLTWPEVARLLVDDAEFRFTWNTAWTDPPEHQFKPVPLHPSTLDALFFAVLAPSRFPRADASAYREHLAALPPGREIATFPNLGGDATLVVPADRGDFGHLAVFCRTASAALADAFWREVGRVARDAIAAGRTCWCNTHGHGVPWLHVRFDDRMKYTAFPPRGVIDASSQREWYARYYERAFPGQAGD